MPKVKRFEDLSIFQMARKLCKDVYAITKEGEFHGDARFVQQIHAAAGSIMDNIAEGYERDGNKVTRTCPLSLRTQRHIRLTSGLATGAASR